MRILATENTVAQKQFSVYYQPKFGYMCGYPLAAEALVKFENKNFITESDECVLAEVAHQIAKWLDAGIAPPPVSVNISHMDLSLADTAEHIRNTVDSYRVPHRLIELGITENAFSEDKDILIYNLRKLQNYGFLISLNNFGIEYSSLSSLKELPIDILILDPGLFQDYYSSKRTRQIISYTIMLAKDLGICTVADGIENIEQVAFLSALECDLLQGSFFSRPLPVEEYEETIRCIRALRQQL